MNKKSKKRAFLVCTVLCLLYAVVAFRLPEKMSMRRISAEEIAPSKGTLLPVPDADIDRNAPPSQRALSPIPVTPLSAETSDAAMGPDVTQTSVPERESLSADISQSGIEPSLLICIPVVCYALKEGWLDKEGLILGKKDAYNNVTWKKPLEILKDRDEDGIRSILSTIGQKRVLEFMEKEGISPPPGLDPGEIILGKGYRVDAKRLLALYNKYVGAQCDGLFPYSLGQTGIARGKYGFEMTKGEDEINNGGKTAETEWMMPNLANLPMRLAIDRLSVHTTRIKVYGNGHVTGQSPKAFERLKGEQECVIQGRAGNE
ncbi:MAG: hypothetical protein ABSE25_04875 [Syntrophorhabdales bacterium]|jgi:hypothetical protein